MNRSEKLMEPALEYCFDLRVAVDPPRRIGGSTAGEMYFTPITGGTVQGSRLNGQDLPGGGDRWVDGGDVVRLDAHYLLQIGDEIVDVVNRGYWRASATAIAVLEAGEQPPEEELYYRTAFTFQTDAPSVRWLAESQFIGYATGTPDEVRIRVFRVI